MHRVAIVSNPRSHFGRCLATKLFDSGYEVRAATDNPDEKLTFCKLFPNTWESISKQLMQGDLIFLELTEDAAEVKFASNALRYLAAAQYNTLKVVVLVSSVMTWARTSEQQLAKARAAIERDRREREAEGEAPDGPPEEPEQDPVDESKHKKRLPHPQYEDWRALEVLCREVHSSTLWTYCIFAGLTYGRGEDRLRDTFRAAWQLSRVGLPWFGDGRNVVPAVHVQDLSTFAFKLATAGEVNEQRYFFGVDGGGCTWGDMVNALNTAMGAGRLHRVRPGDEILYGNVQYMTVNLKVESTLMNETLDAEEWVSQSGFVENIKTICKEYITAHGLQPLRAHIIGPPCSGKTFYGKMLADKYSVPYICVKDSIEEFEAQAVTLVGQIEERKFQHRVQKILAKIAEKKLAQEEERRRRKEERDAKDEGEEEDFGENGDLEEDADEPVALTKEEEEAETEDPALQELQDKLAYVRKVMRQKKVPRPSQEKREEEDPVEPEEGAQKVRAKGPFVKGILKHPSKKVAEKTPQPPPAPRYSDKALAVIIRWKLQQPSCRNQGYILDGFPKTVAQARLLYEEREEELEIPDEEDDQAQEANEPPQEEDQGPPAPCHEAFLPEYVFNLIGSDQFLTERFMRLASLTPAARPNAAAFLRRLQYFKDNSKKHVGLQDFTSTLVAAVPEGSGAPGREARVLDVFVDRSPLVPAPPTDDPLFVYTDYAFDLMVATLGVPYLFEPPPAALMKDQQRTKLIKESEEEKERQQKEEEERVRLRALEEREEWLEGNERRLGAVRAHVEASAPVREMTTKRYLMKYVIPTVTRGMVEVCRLRPDDPIDYLADWIFDVSASETFGPC